MPAPRDEADLAECLAATRTPYELIAAGTKRELGCPVEAEALHVSALTGVLDYEPAEMVLTARAATPLHEVQAVLAAAGQRLAFDPPPGGTVGGVLAANLSGSRRVTAGAARDHFLGFRAVSGRGERFKAGGKVVKNVTGYDLPKLLAGSWGTLAVLTEVSLRAVPAAECEVTLCVPASDAAQAVRLMSASLGSMHEVSSAAFDPRDGLVLLRVEGFAAAVDSRVAALVEQLAAGAECETLRDARSRERWQTVGAGGDAFASRIVWRIGVAPTEAPRLVAEFEPERYVLDWGGGRMWLGCASLEPARVRAAVRGGHATLVKASPAERAATAVFPPLPVAHAELAARVKAAFDPDGRLNPGRMG
jgi:glycolate oxidase FAD binding subunit